MATHIDSQLSLEGERTGVSLAGQGRQKWVLGGILCL
jgi:hypothetical protein